MDQEDLLGIGTNISYNDLEMSKEIGRGAFSVVYLGKLYGTPVAIKELVLRNEKAIADARDEVNILTTLRHPNIVMCIGCVVHHDKLFIANELCPRGSLENILDQKMNGLTDVIKIRMIRDIARGMFALHRQGIIHRDLKVSNLLVTQDFSVKISDFGLSQLKPRDSDQIVERDHRGTWAYLAPEVLRDQPFNENIDVYSFALVCWEILTGKEAFSHIHDCNALVRAVCKLKQRPTLPPGLHPRLSALLEVCWHDNPRHRPNFRSILNQLNVLYIETAVDDPVGQQVWLSPKLIDKEQAPWDVFEATLVKVLEGHGYAYQSHSRSALSGSMVNHESHKSSLTQLRRLFTSAQQATGGSPHLSDRPLLALTDFGRLLHFYGPILEHPTGTPNFLERICRLCMCPWFFGDLDVSKAEILLEGRPRGTFLVRLSGQLGNFTISKVQRDGKVSHQRIGRDDHTGEFVLFWSDSDKQYRTSTLEEMIAQVSTYLKLQRACPGAPFSTERNWEYLRSSVDVSLPLFSLDTSESVGADNTWGRGDDDADDDY